MTKIKRIKIAFDLDGILIDKPPFIPKQLLEWLFKGGDGGRLHYRFPKSKAEQLVRKLSHFYLFRPPIKENIEIVKKLAKEEKYELYIISARYSFLEKETKQLLEKRGIGCLFKEVFINLEDKQPHIFKAETLERVNPQIFVEDDPLLINYILQKNKKSKIIFCSPNSETKRIPGVSSVGFLKEVDFSAK